MNTRLALRTAQGCWRLTHTTTWTALLLTPKETLSQYVPAKRGGHQDTRHVHATRHHTKACQTTRQRARRNATA